MIRVEDTIAMEEEQAKEKYPAIYDIIGLEVRNIFGSRKVTKLLIKYYYDFNYYRMRDAKISQQNTSSKCSCYS